MPRLNHWSGRELPELEAFKSDQFSPCARNQGWTIKSSEKSKGKVSTASYASGQTSGHPLRVFHSRWLFWTEHFRMIAFMKPAKGSATNTVLERPTKSPMVLLLFAARRKM